MIIEQRSNNGGSIVRRYTRGKFLGKVIDDVMQGGFAKCY
jgi:hypothetical protein